MQQENNINLLVQKFIYLYQTEFHNVGFNTRGFYLDGSGNQYHYVLPEKEIKVNVDSIIKSTIAMLDADSSEWFTTADDNTKPTDLFRNLNLCSHKASSLKLKLTTEIIEDLASSPIIEVEQFIMDAGWKTSYILFYHAELDVYKRILLASCGNTNKLNTSIFTDGLLKTLTP